MIKYSKLPAVLTALCLLCSLPGAAPAQSAEKPAETAQTGGWQPELIGAWFGLHDNLWAQYTFYRNWNEKYRLTVFEDHSLDRSGNSETFGTDYTIKVSRNLMQLTVRGMTSTFRRLPNPYVRLKTEDAAIIPSVDPLLVGSWGGRSGDDYVEWTFRGDGGFSRVTPYEAIYEAGNYISGGGALSLVLGFIMNSGKAVQGAYRISQDSLTLDLPGQGRLILKRKAGQMEQPNLLDLGITALESRDFGWKSRYVAVGGARGYVAVNYLGSDTDVDIPHGISWEVVVAIGASAFQGNGALKRVTVPIYVTEIGSCAFEGCESLTDVLFIGTQTAMHLPQWEGGIVPGAEYFSPMNLAGVPAVPGSCRLKSIGEGAFRGCVRLENLNLAMSAEQSRHWQWRWIGRGDVRGINIPDGVELIGAGAFEGCESIKSVTIPDSVTEIGKDAFKGCPNLVLMGSEGSYAMKYARENGIPFILRGE